MFNILCSVSYDGSAFSGWQIQPDKITVQSVIEKALTGFFGQKIRIVAAGRTDAGVHALKNYFNFKVDKLETPIEKIPLIINHKITDAVKVLSAELKDESFSARYSAVRRIYEYKISLKHKTPFNRNYFYFLNEQPDIKLMEKAVSFLIGEHDFSGFRASDCCADNPVRTFYKSSIDFKDSIITLHFEANAYLKNMIRIITGTLVDIGLKKNEPEIIKQILETKNRQLAGKTISPYGLYFVDAVYEHN